MNACSEIHRNGHDCQFCHHDDFEPADCGVCGLLTCYSDCTYCDKCREDICGNCACEHFAITDKEGEEIEQ